MADTDTNVPQVAECPVADGCEANYKRGVWGAYWSLWEEFTTIRREEVLKIRRKLANSQPFRKDAARTNERGIPYAPFVDRVEDYVTTRADVEPTLKRFQEMIS
ncbi:hypothetical protein BPAE_0085g00490 [Botrytis paeoniae]|uniref:Uncharacterized protein n=1 Tax=Botrytis paeoniae TaxID=278948 RepID=A0A4Z1FNX5_9HELO|nr:hypothetical protein BPAE_0085g00490 [Botrytis paeoniae]